MGNKHHRLAELHRKYGHVVRINHDELSWTEPNAWKDVRIPSRTRQSILGDLQLTSRLPARR